MVKFPCVNSNATRQTFTFLPPTFHSVLKRVYKELSEVLCQITSPRTNMCWRLRKNFRTNHDMQTRSIFCRTTTPQLHPLTRHWSQKQFVNCIAPRINLYFMTPPVWYIDGYMDRNVGNEVRFYKSRISLCNA